MKKQNKAGKLLLAVAAMVVAAIAMSTMVFAMGEKLTPTKMYYGNEKLASKSYGYNQNSVTGGMDTYERGIVIPIHAKQAGTFKIVLDVTQLQKDLTVEMYSDAACKSSVGFSTYLKMGETTNTKYFSVSNSGDFYLKIHSSKFGDETYNNQFVVKAGLFTNGTKTIKSGQTIKYFRINEKTKYFFKYTATKTGKVTVKLPYKFGSYLTLLNSKKQIISEEDLWVSDMYSSQHSFAVKKGTTYYFRVTSNGSSSSELQSISLKEKTVKEKSGSKKSKAVTIKKNKTIQGMIVQTSKETDWYRFQISSKSRIAISVGGDITGTLGFTVYDKNGNPVGNLNNRKFSTKWEYDSFSKLPKGTYYVRINRGTKVSGGIYSLKWKTK